MRRGKRANKIRLIDDKGDIKYLAPVTLKLLEFADAQPEICCPYQLYAKNKCIKFPDCTFEHDVSKAKFRTAAEWFSANEARATQVFKSGKMSWDDKP